ncbi:unnamed protein product [Onchocerca flexuosa]|uniref:S8_pro-domain domain-containing protein n=1 Tax=Onchocerca flexuosa TaxID=387005 RepID=A0A183HBB4_9BILA|nr:unnamed protein product [Onchocerca flexuosa]
MYWHLVRILVLFDCLQRILAIEHDSICTANDDTCPEPSHIVMRLREKNDEKAHLIAKRNGLEIKGKPFLDGKSYFVTHLSKQRSRRRKREIISRLQEHPDILSIEEQRPRYCKLTVA